MPLPLLFSGLQLAMKLSLAKYQITKSNTLSEQKMKRIFHRKIQFFIGTKAMKDDYFPKFLLHILATKIHISEMGKNSILTVKAHEMAISLAIQDG